MLLLHQYLQSFSMCFTLNFILLSIYVSQLKLVWVICWALSVTASNSRCWCVLCSGRNIIVPSILFSVGVTQLHCVFYLLLLKFSGITYSFFLSATWVARSEHRVSRDVAWITRRSEVAAQQSPLCCLSLPSPVMWSISCGNKYC